MAWDDEKEDLDERPDVDDEKKLTAEEWNEHVEDQKGRAESPHGETHGADGEDSLDVEALGTEGAAGTAPVSQGDGTLAMEEVGGNGDDVMPWQTDDIIYDLRAPEMPLPPEDPNEAGDSTWEEEFGNPDSHAKKPTDDDAGVYVNRGY